MAKKVYAYTDTAPASTTYLTAGKRYEVLKEDGGLFRAYSDTGNLNVFLWEGCAHLEGGNWTREEIGAADSRQAGADIEITPRMVEAGLGVLARSGAVETPLASDGLLVAEIYQSMAICRDNELTDQTGSQYASSL